MPKPDASATELNTFAVKLQNVVYVLKTIDKRGFLYNPLLAREVLDKLSPHIQSRWCDYAADHEGTAAPEIVVLSRFLMREADRALRYMYSPAATTRREVRPAIVKRKRWNMVREKGVCFRCVEKRHRRQFCKAKLCGVNQSPPTPPYSARETESTHCAACSTPTTPPSVTPPNAPKHHESVLSLGTLPPKEKEVLLKVVPVTVTGPLGSVETHALMDEGATITLIDEELAQRIGAEGPSTPLRLHGVNMTRQEHQQQHQSRTEYDFVFSVDIKDGAPAIKLPYNKTEDPWVAAQAFIHKNNLPQVYLDQVANFIVTNAKLDTLPASSNGYSDPFTGESRYVPGTGPAGGTGLPPPSSTDPFTGSGAYTTSSVTTQLSAGDKPLIPHDAYIRFDQANLKAIYDKLKEFNSKIGDGLAAFTDEQLSNIVKLGELNSSYSPDSVSCLKQMLEWPKEILFPVLDVTRLAVRNKEINGLMFDSAYGPNFIKYLLTLLTPDNLPANQMLAMRVLVNAFSDLPGEMLILAARESIIHTIICLNELNNNGQIAAASLLLNLSVALAQQSDNIELADALMLLLSRVTDNEAYFRGLVALGTLLAESPNKLQIQTKIVSNNQLHNRLKRDCTNNDPNVKKIAACSQQIVKLL
ncbi:phospholipase A-2-activating protein [Hyposmocoma kahamanoa]|uniref:phospholipase A-2-activating protein n=1 Tax=Hyposmocoma kahamanoa TaxID=1477025 RepID=UPI000E6DA108|nr:phospholipase A-2-activating protein [Hyposmocoma kahamanoa]